MLPDQRHGYLEEDKSMIHSSTVTFRAKYLTDMVTSVPLYEGLAIYTHDLGLNNNPAFLHNKH
jgi:hypothetical protein